VELEKKALGDRQGQLARPLCREEGTNLVTAPLEGSDSPGSHMTPAGKPVARAGVSKAPVHRAPMVTMVSGRSQLCTSHFPSCSERPLRGMACSCVPGATLVPEVSSGFTEVNEVFTCDEIEAKQGRLARHQDGDWRGRDVGPQNWDLSCQDWEWDEARQG
jgi:hypothetical protein